MRSQGIKLKIFSIFFAGFFLAISGLVSAHSHGKVTDDHPHACSVCQFANSGRQAEVSPCPAPWLGWKTQSFLLSAQSLPSLLIDFQTPDIRGPPALG